MSTTSRVTENPKPDAAGEPCPTPLVWRQVLTAVHEQREEFTFAWGGRELHGATLGSGRPLYFLGPIAGGWELFALTACLLREEFRCRLIELPELRYAADAATYVTASGDAVTAAADSLGDQTVALFGASLGGTIALQTLAMYPERFEAAVLIGTAARRRLTLMERAMLIWGGLLPGRLRQLPGWKRVLEQNHRHWFPPFDQSRWQFLLQNLGETPIALAARRQSVLGGVNLREQLPGITQPVLIVRTEGEGRILTEHQKELQQGLPSAEVEEMRNAGQLPYLTHPHRVAKLVRRFLVEKRDSSD